MNTPATSKEDIAKLDYRPHSILLRAIESFYIVYSQMYLPDSLKTDLRIGAESLVKQYVTVIKNGTITQTKAAANVSMGNASQNIHDIIREVCKGKSEQMFHNLTDEAAAWLYEIISVN